MRHHRYVRYAIGIALAQALAACGSAAAPGTAANLPDAAAASVRSTTVRGALLYVSDPAANTVSIYSYPALAFKGKISQLKRPGSLCTDPRTGAVWVLSGNGFSARLSEFEHGHVTPSRRLKITLPYLNACAVNPKTGDVAITQINYYDDAGQLVVVDPATGKLAEYQSKDLFFYSFVGYDSDGDAFVDGFNGSGRFKLVTLRAGGDRLTDATPPNLQPRSAGGIAYDGSDLAVGEQKRGVVYRISGKELVGKTYLSGICLMRQFAIDDGVLIAPNACAHGKGEVLLYEYPAGGSSTDTLSGFTAPFAVAISQ